MIKSFSFHSITILIFLIFLTEFIENTICADVAIDANGQIISLSDDSNQINQTTVNSDKLRSPPTIDISDLDDSITISEIADACKEWGFFHISNHGLSSHTLDEFYASMKQFFYLPLDQKKSVKRTGTNARGFYDDELTKNTKDWKQGFDFGHKPNKNLPDNATENIVMDGYNQFPEDLPDFKEHMENYYEMLADIAEKLTRAIAVGLDLPAGYFNDQIFGMKHTSYLRLNYYPVCSDPNSNLGVNRHTDAGFLTVLFQDEVAALEVNNRNEWVRVDPVKDAFTINVGDMLQVFTNGLYKAPEHRVKANGQKERFSAPFFYNPSYEAEISPLETCIDNENPLKYNPINWGHFRKQRFLGDFEDQGIEDIQIAHYLVNK